MSDFLLCDTGAGPLYHKLRYSCIKHIVELKAQNASFYCYKPKQKAVQMLTLSKDFQFLAHMQGDQKFLPHSNNKQKTEQTEKSTTLVRFLREDKTQDKPLTPKLQRQMNTGHWHLTEQRLMGRAFVRTSTRRRKPKPCLTNTWSLSVDNFQN